MSSEKGKHACETVTQESSPSNSQISENSPLSVEKFIIRTKAAEAKQSDGSKRDGRVNVSNDTESYEHDTKLESVQSDQFSHSDCLMVTTKPHVNIQPHTDDALSTSQNSMAIGKIQNQECIQERHDLDLESKMDIDILKWMESVLLSTDICS